MFESETDTEVIAKLAKHVYDTYAHDGSFREIVEMVIHQLVRLLVSLIYNKYSTVDSHYLDLAYLEVKISSLF